MASNKGFSDRTRIKYRFKQDDFDFFFQWMVGGQTNGGVEAGECFFAASEIQEGDTDSWVASWTALAKRVKARAKTSLERGHLVSARFCVPTPIIAHRCSSWIPKIPDIAGSTRRLVCVSGKRPSCTRLR